LPKAFTCSDNYYVDNTPIAVLGCLAVIVFFFKERK